MIDDHPGLTAGKTAWSAGPVSPGQTGASFFERPGPADQLADAFAPTFGTKYILVLATHDQFFKNMAALQAFIFINRHDHLPPL